MKSLKGQSLTNWNIYEEKVRVSLTNIFYHWLVTALTTTPLIGPSPPLIHHKPLTTLTHIGHGIQVACWCYNLQNMMSVNVDRAVLLAKLVILLKAPRVGNTIDLDKFISTYDQ